MQLYFYLLEVSYVLLLATVSFGKECIKLQDVKRAIPCCKVHNLLPTHEFGQECEAENRHLLQPDDQESWPLCNSKCLAEKSGVIVEETVHVEPLYRYADYFRQPIGEAYRAAIERCSQLELRGGTEAGQWKCSTLATKLEFCLLVNLVFSCPEELKVDSEVCRQFREKVPVCK